MHSPGTDLKIRGYVVAQFPNPPLLVAFAALAIGWLLDEASGAYDYSRAVFYIGLAIWAWLEVAGGVNGFRRVLGVAGLLYVVIRLGDLIA